MGWRRQYASKCSNVLVAYVVVLCKPTAQCSHALWPWRLSLHNTHYSYMILIVPVQTWLQFVYDILPECCYYVCTAVEHSYTDLLPIMYMYIGQPSFAWTWIIKLCHNTVLWSAMDEYKSTHLNFTCTTVYISTYTPTRLGHVATHVYMSSYKCDSYLLLCQ